eukprot:TRINITY_DN30384_c0_g1_i1.p2 TRINITY_DN30384_c0_g1~~TRINITY_DN30384_c0_g1_i1.p2  ORF type:complete len:201 (+),score=36.75 TRINITY_DN30384_c0_g1_i1:222-824(+)
MWFRGAGWTTSCSPRCAVSLSTTYGPGLATCILMLTPLANHPWLRNAWTAFHAQVLGGALCGMVFRDRDPWAKWVPPLYDVCFYVHHWLTLLVPVYLCWGKLRWRSASDTLSLTLFVSLPSSFLLHFGFYQPVSLLSGANLQYMLCPIKKVRKWEQAGVWPFAHELWPALLCAAAAVAGTLSWYCFGLPLLNALRRMIVR